MAFESAKVTSCVVAARLTELLIAVMTLSVIVVKGQSFTTVRVKEKLVVQGSPVPGLLRVFKVPLIVTTYTPRSAFEMEVTVRYGLAGVDTKVTNVGAEIAEPFFV